MDEKPHAVKLAGDVGSFFESTVGSLVEHTMEAPVLKSGEFPEPMVWYKVELEEGMCGDGSPYHMYLKKGRTADLCVFLSAGGVVWNAWTAARPTTWGSTAAREPNFYWNNLRPLTQLMNINTGITTLDEANPFADWNFLVIPYATGDFHIGNGSLEYTDLEGVPQVLHFHGHANVMAAMEQGKKHFPSASRILLAGDSAGAFGVPALADEILAQYPDCNDITLLSDSGQLPNEDWTGIARDVWHADEKYWNCLSTRNITLDWYENLLQHTGRHMRLLYASSTHDYLLSTFFNDMTNEVFATDADVRNAYFEEMKHMVRQLNDLGFAFFCNAWENPLFTKAQHGTIHTAVRTPYFFTINNAPPGTMENHVCLSGVSMAEWLMDQVNDVRYDVGTGLLEE